MFKNFVSDKFFANNQKRNILFLKTDFVFSKLILFQNLLQFFVSETKNVKSKRKPYLRNEKRSKISFQMGKCIKGHTQSYNSVWIWFVDPSLFFEQLCRSCVQNFETKNYVNFALFHVLRKFWCWTRVLKDAPAILDPLHPSIHFLKPETPSGSLLEDRQCNSIFDTNFLLF